MHTSEPTNKHIDLQPISKHNVASRLSKVPFFQPWELFVSNVAIEPASLTNSEGFWINTSVELSFKLWSQQTLGMVVILDQTQSLIDFLSYE